MITLVRAGEEMQHRNALGVEAGLIGRAVAIAARRDLEMRLGARGVEQRSPLGGGVGAEGGELIVFELSDHVEVHHGHNVIEPHGRMIDEP